MHVKLNMILDICKTLSYWLPRLNMQRQKYLSNKVWIQFYTSKRNMKSKAYARTFSLAGEWYDRIALFCKFCSVKTAKKEKKLGHFAN